VSKRRDNVIEFLPKQPIKYGFERVKRRRRNGSSGQPDLFSPSAEILRLPSKLSPFEEALLLDERNDGRTEEAYRRAIQEGDCVDGAYCNLGILLSKAGQTAKAFDCFTKGLQHNPRHFQSQFNLGNFYFEQDNLRLARMHYELAIELQPDFASVYFNVALVAALSNDLVFAIEALQRYKALAADREGNKVNDLLEKLQRALNAQNNQT
jgi:tetratricopeptide (TPR) repeat protein